MDRREGETDACTAYIRHDSDTMEGPFTQCSLNDAAKHTAVASDLDGVQWIPQDGEGSTVVVHHADSTH